MGHRAVVLHSLAGCAQKAPARCGCCQGQPGREEGAGPPAKQQCREGGEGYTSRGREGRKSSKLNAAEHVRRKSGAGKLRAREVHMGHARNTSSDCSPCARAQGGAPTAKQEHKSTKGQHMGGTGRTMVYDSHNLGRQPAGCARCPRRSRWAPCGCVAGTACRGEQRQVSGGGSRPGQIQLGLARHKGRRCPRGACPFTARRSG